MTEEKQEGQKTIVSFIVGLLIGGLLVWAFSAPTDTSKDDNKDKDDKKEQVEEKDVEKSTENKDEAKTTESKEVKALEVGEGKVSVGDITAGNNVALSSVTFPVSEGWIGVRDYMDGQLGGLLGVSRFSESQGLVPTEVALQRATAAGKTYAIVIYTESGDKQFSMANDVQLDTIFATFTAK